MYLMMEASGSNKMKKLKEQAWERQVDAAVTSQMLQIKSVLLRYGIRIFVFYMKMYQIIRIPFFIFENYTNFDHIPGSHDRK